MKSIVLTACTGASLVASAAEQSLPDDTTRSEQPNIIVILADDQGYGDLSCYGATDLATPHIDKMATEGTRFTSFYTSSVCSPARASLMTGCRAQRVGVAGVLFPRHNHGLNPAELTIPELLKEQGYSTAIIGKWHLGYGDIFNPLNHGFDYWYGTVSSNSSSFYTHSFDYADDCVYRDGFTAESIRDQETVGCPLIRNREVVEIPAEQPLLTKRLTGEAIQFIKKNKEKPFFLYLPHNMPHIPLHASEAFVGTSNRGIYGDVIQELDWGVGEVLKTLKDLNLDENTLVIFTSDNGAKLQFGGSAGSLRGGKGDTFEGGVRVPCIMRWPGKIPSKRVNNESITMMDILPTLVTLAGGKIPSDRVIDGKDIWPLVSGETNAKSPHEAIYYYRVRNIKGVRVGDWKFLNVESKGKTPIKLTKEEKKLPKAERKALMKKRAKEAGGAKTTKALFNLRTDIGEQNNVIDKNPEIAQRLEKMMIEYHAKLQREQREPGIAAETVGKPR